jgi:hypothetical protein
MSRTWRMGWFLRWDGSVSAANSIIPLFLIIIPVNPSPKEAAVLLSLIELAFMYEL